MTQIQGPIGVFDSGVGGLTVLKELARSLPHAQFVYLGDTARTPYGSKGRETIIRYACECRDFLLTESIQLLVVACNTASSFALEILERESKFPVIGTIQPAVKAAVEGGSCERVGVIGTEATVASGVYEKYLRGINPEIEVYSKACPLFVPLVEQGMFDGEIVDKVVELYLGEMQQMNLDGLILGCTHYPLLIDSIARYMGKGVRIVECSKAIANEVKGLMPAVTQPTVQGNSRYFVTDGIERFNKIARIFMDNSLVSAGKVQF